MLSAHSSSLVVLNNVLVLVSQTFGFNTRRLSQMKAR